MQGNGGPPVEAGGGSGASNGEMPGRLIMDQQGAVGSQNLKKDRSQAQESMQHQHQPPVRGPSVSPVKGQIHDAPHGMLAPNEPLPTTNGDTSVTEMAPTGPDNPPALDQSWRDLDDNKSIGLLMTRTAQMCYTNLNDTLTKMTEVTMEPRQQQLNGIIPHAGQDTLDGSLKKKRLLMEFAEAQRNRFIKTLVLSDWCRNEADQSRLIDVKAWEDQQLFAHVQAARAVGQTKINMIAAKMPNPNIQDAMELLATGKASWVPDLHYIPPKRLSAKELLKTLRSMNVTLATRLNLHEEIPPYFQDFSVADGRATFTVEDEFEVDLSVADEDPATPFYFIDIRFLFTPASNVLDEGTRGLMEGAVNYALATKGLKGCYDRLHNFVLTHKINVLRNQAAELLRGKWFNCVRPETLRRSLAVQYWTGMPGPKSWIEIGISSGKQKNSCSRRPPTPKISVRWIRRGVEVQDEVLEFDWRDLDLEKCLNIVIRKHTALIMSNLQNRLRGLASADSPFVARLTSPDTDSEDSVLLLTLPSLLRPLRVRMDAITGQYSISPPSLVTLPTEQGLNQDPSIDSARWLAGLVCALVQDCVGREANLLGWTSVSDLRRQDNLQAVFGEQVRFMQVFVPRRAWGNKWALAVTFSLEGEKWWAVRLDGKVNEQGALVVKIITGARRVSVSAEEKAFSISQSSLMRIERAAAAEVAFGVLSKQLRESSIPHHVEKVVLSANDEQVLGGSGLPSAAMFIRFSSFMGSGHHKTWKPWADEVVRLTHHGIAGDADSVEEGFGCVRHDLRLSLEPGKMEQLQKLLTHFRDRDLAMNSTGGLALRFLTPFGAPFAEQMRKRLQSVERLDGYVATLKKRNFACSHVNLSRLAFKYNSSPDLSAQLSFSNDGGLPVRLRLEPPDSNPHSRIGVMLEQGLSNTATNEFTALTFMLSLTLPLLQAFERLEAMNSVKQTLSVHPRTSTWYILKYNTPLPACVFQIRAKTMPDKRPVRWHILPTKIDPSEDLVKALKDLWQETSEHWSGVGNGIIADAVGVGPAVERLDEVVRRFEGTGQNSTKQAEATHQAVPELPKSQSRAPASGQAQQKAGSKQAAPAPVKNEPDVIVVD